MVILLMFLEIVAVAKLLATRLALVRLVVGRLVFVIGVRVWELLVADSARVRLLVGVCGLVFVQLCHVFGGVGA